MLGFHHSVKDRVDYRREIYCSRDEFTSGQFLRLDLIDMDSVHMHFNVLRCGKTGRTVCTAARKKGNHNTQIYTKIVNDFCFNQCFRVQALIPVDTSLRSYRVLEFWIRLAVATLESSKSFRRV